MLLLDSNFIAKQSPFYPLLQGAEQFSLYFYVDESITSSRETDFTKVAGISLNMLLKIGG